MLLYNFKKKVKFFTSSKNQERTIKYLMILLDTVKPFN